MNNKRTTANDMEPIFIVGMARSGTTLLRTILNSHPKIAIPRETTFFYLVDSYIKAHKVSSFSKGDVDRFWSWYIEKRKFTYLGLEASAIEPYLDNSEEYTWFKNVLDAVMSLNLSLNKKHRWGEKTPGHERYLEQIFDLYPKAKVLFMIRDPRAVYASINKVPWNNQFVSVIVKRWNESISIYKRFKKDNRIVLVTYEELVNDTSKTVRDICDFVGEEFTDEMINRRMSDVPDENDKSWTTSYEKSVVNKKIDDRSLATWKSEISDFDVSIIESFVDKEMFNSLYERQGKKIVFTQYLRYFYLKIKYYVGRKFFVNVK